MRQNLPDDHRVFDTGESLPRERSECFGHDSHRPAAGRAGLDINAKHPFQTSPPGAYFWCAQVMAARQAAGVFSSTSSANSAKSEQVKLNAARDFLDRTSSMDLV
jgi:hypothetical protein